MPRAKPPTEADLLLVLDRLVPVEYLEPIKQDKRGSFALYRAMAKGYAVLAEKIYRSAQASFYLQSSLQGDLPASSGVRSSATVRLERTTDIDQGLIIAAGAMVLEGPQVRNYTNKAAVEWIPYDTEPVRDVVFEAVAPGFVFNLDHIADGEGLITDGIFDPASPGTATPDFDAVFVVDLALSRAGTKASIVAAVSVDDRARLVESGRPDRFIATDEDLYVRIDAATSSANVGRVLRAVGFEDPGTEDPPGSGLFPRRLILDDQPQRFRLQSAQADDGGVFTDETVAANQESPDDMTLTPAVPVAGDAYYFGSSSPSSSLALAISQVAQGTSLALAWEFWDGAAYVAIPDVSDGTALGVIGFGKSGTVSWGDLLTLGWVTDTVNGVTAFYVRARITGVPVITQQPLGQQAYTLNPNQLDSESGTVSWTIMDWTGLGVEVKKIAAFSGGRDNDLRLMGDERKVTQQSNETDDAFRNRASRLAEVVSPQAIRNAVNRALEPMGLRGEAFDVQQDGQELTFFNGFFADVDAADYYEPGDVFPESPFKLPLSYEEAYGSFFVRLPYLGGSGGQDFGIFADEGPIVNIDPPDVFLGPAADEGFVDGFAIQGDAITAGIFDIVTRIRLGGVGVIMLRDAALNIPECP